MQIIIVSHGNLSKALLESAEMIMGKQNDVFTFGLYPGEDSDDLKKKVDEKISELPACEEILVLSDLFYGSPFNAMISLLNKHKFHHITGINLPILLEILSGRENISKDISFEDVIEKSTSTIIDVNRFLKVDF